MITMKTNNANFGLVQQNFFEIVLFFNLLLISSSNSCLFWLNFKNLSKLFLLFYLFFNLHFMMLVIFLNSFLTGYQKCIRIITNLKQHIQSGRLMILPLVLLHFLIKYFVIVLPVTHVDDQVMPIMFLLQIFHHIIDWISVSLLQASGRVGHCDDGVGYVSEVEVKILGDGPVFGAGD